jgi:hypothetical protein
VQIGPTSDCTAAAGIHVCRGRHGHYVAVEAALLGGVFVSPNAAKRFALDEVKRRPALRAYCDLGTGADRGRCRGHLPQGLGLASAFVVENRR